MTAKLTSDPESRFHPALRPSFGPHGGSIRPKTAILLVALAAASFLIYQKFLAQPSTEEDQTSVFIPLVNPILEADRPDLIGEAPTEE